MDYMQLFLELRNNAVVRDAQGNLLESGLRCGYRSGGTASDIWGADPYHSLSAWRGVITALMTDFNYIYE